MDNQTHDIIADQSEETRRLRLKVSQLEEENRELREELVRMTTVEREVVKDWRSVGW